MSRNWTVNYPCCQAIGGIPNGPLTSVAVIWRHAVTTVRPRPDFVCQIGGWSFPYEFDLRSILPVDRPLARGKRCIGIETKTFPDSEGSSGASL